MLLRHQGVRVLKRVLRNSGDHVRRIFRKGYPPLCADKHRWEKDMKWLKIRIKTTTEAEDIMVSDMCDIGLEGAQIEDNVPLTAREKEQMFVDILPDGPKDDGTAYLNFFVEIGEDGELKMGESLLHPEAASVISACIESTDADNTGVDRKDICSKEELLRRIDDVIKEEKQYVNVGDGTVTCEETADIDWINNWKNYFHQFYIDDLVVSPSWEEIKPEDEGKKVLHIDPGTAFGTGMHETTQLCVRQIRKFLKNGDRILDVGTGSGILAIIAMMYGAGSAVGTDLDPCAVDAVSENKATNDIKDESFELIIGNIIDDKDVQDKAGYECYDIVVANILAEVLVMLTPEVVNHMKHGAYYITSGILAEKEQIVRDAVTKAGLQVVEVTHQGEWCCVTARKQ